MEDGLLHDFDAQEEDPEEGEYDTQYKHSAKWDPALGDFARDGSNQVVRCSGQEAYMIWCYKMVQTEREAHLAYMEAVSGADLGVEMEEAMQEDDRETAESMIERTITEALEVNPRTEYVGDFAFTWEGDSVHARFKVKGAGWDDTIQISF